MGLFTAGVLEVFKIKRSAIEAGRAHLAKDQYLLCFSLWRLGIIGPVVSFGSIKNEPILEKASLGRNKMHINPVLSIKS